MFGEVVNVVGQFAEDLLWHKYEVYCCGWVQGRHLTYAARLRSQYFGNQTGGIGWP